MVLASCKKVRAPRRLAARTGGAAVKPPMARANWGGRLLKYILDIRRDCQKRHRNPAALPRASPTAGSRTTSMSPAAAAARRSISLHEISSVTAQPRRRNSRPTASPGNKCPPVPPQAMATTWGEPEVAAGLFIAQLWGSIKWIGFRLRRVGGKPGNAQQKANAHQHQQ